MPPTGLLARDGRQRSVVRARLNPAAGAALAQLVALAVGLYAGLHYIQGHLHKQPLLLLLFPLLAMGSIAAALPLLMFLSYQEDFRTLNPLHPLHFVTIARRCYGALSRNNLKVSEKDL